MVQGFQSSDHRSLAVGLVGTGYVAQRRAAALAQQDQAVLAVVAGRSAANVAGLAATYGARVAEDWRAVVRDPAVDLVFVATTNGERESIVRAALEADKHVVTEYPLAIDPQAAAALVDLAQAHDRLLHVEHIELIGGVHQALLSHLPRLDQPIFARYSTIAPQVPGPKQWAYCRSQFGFPLVGALSRLRRLTDAFGPVAQVSATARYWPEPIDQPGADRWFTEAHQPPEQYFACWCSARLEFRSGLVAEVIYAKGDRFAARDRRLEVWGTAGALIFDGDGGRLIQGDLVEPLTVSGRQGLFAQDTAAAIAAILERKPLYTQTADSLQALAVADAARRSAAANGAIVPLV